ncbi:MAG: DNA-protecting protein DprA [Flavobacteriales bacterium]|nr:DNA-protecting protein DprA [Flavobacteriales bacterium]
MKNLEEIQYTLAIKLCKGIGNVALNKILSQFDSAKTAWNLPQKELISIFGISSPATRFFGNDEILNQAKKEIDVAIKNGIKIHHIKDDDYPKLLKEIPDAPALIFRKGNNFDVSRKNISVVGTRNITNYGKEFIHNFIEEIKSHQVNIISGYAFGVDIETQKKCLEENVSTYGVLAHGLSELYPKSHQDIGNKILAEQGGFYSEYLYNTKPIKEYFIQRNRIIAGLSDVTLVIESAYGGGAISTANFANQYNREVFALAGKVTDKYSQGCNELIKKNQAQILTSPKDILEYLNLKPKKNQVTKQLPLFIELSESEQKIIKIIQDKQRIQIDELVSMVDVPRFSLMSSLLELELKGIVNPLSGKYYEIK